MKTIGYLKKRYIGKEVNDLGVRTRLFNYKLHFHLKSNEDLSDDAILNILTEIERTLRKY